MNLEGTHPFLPTAGDTLFDEGLPLSRRRDVVPRPGGGLGLGGWVLATEEEVGGKGTLPARSETGRSGGRSYLAALGPSIAITIPYRSWDARYYPLVNSPSTGPSWEGRRGRVLPWSAGVWFSIDAVDVIAATGDHPENGGAAEWKNEGRCGLGVWVFLGGEGGAGWMIVVLWVWVTQVLDSRTNGFFLRSRWLEGGTIGGEDTMERGLEAGCREGEWMGSTYIGL